MRADRDYRALLERPGFGGGLKAWHTLVTGTTLFDALTQAVTGGMEYDPLELARGWEGYIEECLAQRPAFYRLHSRSPEELRFQWDGVRTLAWCAQRAHQARTAQESAGNSPDDGGGMRSVFRAFGDLPPFARDRRQADICIRSFLGDQTDRRVEVPVALLDLISAEEMEELEEGAGSSAAPGAVAGRIAFLALEIFSQGSGAIAQHPCDLFTSYPVRPSFHKSLEDAWKAACKTASGAPPLPDGRWRLVYHGLPVGNVGGPSAGGAAGRGWRYALEGKVPDAGVVAMMKIDAEGNLGPVSGVRIKAAAVAREPLMDTIVVVADQENDALAGAAGSHVVVHPL